MPVTLGNLWQCDNPECKNKRFIPRTSTEPFPKGWLNTELDGGSKYVVACSTACVGAGITAVSTEKQGT